MPKFECSQGEDFEITRRDRAYGGAVTTPLSVDGNTGDVAVGEDLAVVGALSVTGAATVGGNVILAGNPFLSVVAAGRNGAGAVTATGAVVGDKVILAINLTDATQASTLFETTVTVANQIQQSSASDLTTKTYSFLFLHQ